MDTVGENRTHIINSNLILSQISILILNININDDNKKDDDDADQ